MLFKMLVELDFNFFLRDFKTLVIQNEVLFPLYDKMATSPINI